jgi:ribonucleotide monophosphatase NagD (HAD superfamily)
MDKLIKHFKSLSKANKTNFKPIIITDIDGVLVRGSTPIPGTL